MSSRTVIRPHWIGNLPTCSDDCPEHDGKRCGLIGGRAPDGHACPIAVERLVAALPGSRLIAETGLREASP